MTTSQNFESFLPVYDTVPEKWEEARPFFVEQLKRISNITNSREIGFYLDEELLTGQQYIPSATAVNQQVFRAVFRKTIDCSPLVVGVNRFAHGLLIDANFTLVHMYGGATNSTLFVGEPLPNGPDTLDYDINDVIITTAAAYDRAYVVMEYLLEV